MAILETKMDNLTESVKKIDTKIDNIIDYTDKKYATKQEVKQEVKEIKEKIMINNCNDTSFREKLFKVGLSLLPTIFLLIVLGVLYISNNGWVL